MKILGINTSTSFGSIGLVDDDRVIGEYCLDSPITHSERLMTSLDHFLTDAGVSIGEIEGFSVVLGPGSFTGLRIGVSAVKGLAFATGRPVTGVSSLEALAENVPFCPNEICPILDARKQEVYVALFRVNDRQLERLTPDMVVSAGDLSERVHGPVTFLGDGVDVYRGLLENGLGGNASFMPPELGHVHGAVVARMGLKLLVRGEVLDLDFSPHYVRRSEAEIRWEEREKRETA